MSDESVTVTVILDPEFGHRLREFALRGPVWITGSETNQDAVRSYWNASTSEFDVTFWSEPRTGESTEEWIGILDDLDLHHSRPWAGPGIAGIEVIGASFSAGAEAALTEFGYRVVRADDRGFFAVREPVV